MSPTERIHNFSAGPAVLPEPVIAELQDALWNLNGSGLGLAECSHRSPLFEAVLSSATERLHRLLGLDDDQEVLFIHGGAASQFFMIPMNLLRGGRAAYHDTGLWAKKAIAEARRFGTVDVVWSSAAQKYDRVPAADELEPVAPDTRYLHYTSNNTVAGTEYHYIPTTDVPLVCDMSSDILARRVDGSRFAMLYAGAQKNLGPSGVTVVVIRKSLLERCDPELPTMLRYRTAVDNQSMYNTPNTFGIYTIERVTAWIEAQGGLDVVEARNRSQAARIYERIDRGGLFRGLVKPASRSIMNLTFTTGDPDLDTQFWKEAAAVGLSGLKGHRSAGGLRASIYNAQTDAAVDALVDFMREFERTRG